MPTTSEILYYAATTIHADGAGINKQPPTVSYTNRFVPTIVSVMSPTQTHVINLLGRDITITLTATNYEYSWGDGTPNTVTTSPGLAWEKGIDPNNDPRLIRHYYTPPQGWRSGFDGPYPHENREITLTTTWSGTRPIRSRGRPRRSMAWSPPPKQRASFRYLTWLSTTLTPGKKNKATRPETTREVDAP